MCPCTELITRYSVCGFFLIVCDLETSMLELGCCATGGGGVIILLISSLAACVVYDGGIPVKNDC
jgi:hypothetical protein